MVIAMTAMSQFCDIDAARDGDLQALDRLLGRSRLNLRRYAEYHCVVNDVEDAVQEALLIASRRIRNLREAEAFNAWLFRIVKRECNRMKRIARRINGEPIEEVILAAPDTPYPALARDIIAAFESLPAHYREVVLLRDFEGLTIDELCQHLGQTREAVKARLHRARMLIREYLV